MNAYKCFALCFVSIMICLALSIIAPPIERFTEALRADCAVAVPGGPKYLNGGRK